MNRHASTVAFARPTASRRRRSAAAAEETPRPAELEETVLPTIPVDVSDAQGLLAAYFRGLSAVEVMNKDEELAAAVRIASLRATF